MSTRKVFVMGAGGQGGPCTSILARDSYFSEVLLADIDKLLLKKVLIKVGSPKIITVSVDANSIEQIVTAAKGCDVIIDLAPPWLAKNIMEAALRVNAHYVNTAFDSPFVEQIVEGKNLELSDDFKRAGLTALLGCGMSPGFLNVLVRYYADRLDYVDSIKLRLGKRRTDQGPYGKIIEPWNPGWSPKQALLDCAISPHVFRNGKLELLEPYSEIEEWEFAKPVGKMLVSHHSHEEVYTLPFTIGKGINYCDFKYYVLPQPAALVSMGLASQELIVVNGVKVKPIDVVAKLMPKPQGGFLEETEDKALYLADNSFMSMMIELIGKKNGEEVIYKVNCPNFSTPVKQLFKLFGTTLVNVALPAIVGAKVILENCEAGVIFPEQLNPEVFLDKFKETGIPYQWHIM